MWHKLSINPIIVESLYGREEYPSLEGALIRELSWKDTPNMVNLSFEPINLPSKFPSRWHDRKYDGAIVNIELYDIYKFQVNIIDEFIRADISISVNKSNDRIVVSIKTDNNSFIVEGQTLMIQTISGYHKESENNA
jgi:hypothetical protein